MANQASTSRTLVDLIEGSDKLGPSDEDEETPKVIKSKKRD